MNKKIVMLLIPLLFIAVAFSSLTFAVPKTLNIGIIGPVGLPHWSPGGMWDAARLARDEINAAGGINMLGGSVYSINLIQADEASYPTINPSQAGINTQNLIDAGAKLIIGGFRTEVVAPGILPVIRLNKVPFFIDGAATNSLVNLTSAALYDSDKYIFRIEPTNDSTLVPVVIKYLKEYLLPLKLEKIYGQDLDNNPATEDQVRVAVITEQLTWADGIHAVLTMPALYGNPLSPYYMGPHYNVTYAARINPYTSITAKPQLDGAEAANCHLLIIIFSAPFGDTIVKEWATLGPYHFFPVGINVMGQLQSHWITAGPPEYEVTMVAAGTVSKDYGQKAQAFFRNFVGNYSAWPIYTAWGAYDGIYAIKELLESITNATAITEIEDYFDDVTTVAPNILINYFEQTDREALLGHFEYTSGIYGPGTGHDIFSIELSTTWPLGYVRPFMVQWYNATKIDSTLTGGYMTVTSPIDGNFSRKTQIPSWMYAYADWDLDFDGKINMVDIGTAARAFGTSTTDKGTPPRFNLEADINLDGTVNMVDIGTIARKFGSPDITLPLTP